MKPVQFSDLKEDFIENISKEWMLVTAKSPEGCNTMTANWGGVGYLWHKPVVFIFIRPERYTFEFLEKSGFFTLSFLGEENKEIHKICGYKSGRDIDKIYEAGLKPVITGLGNMLFEQSRLSLECRKLYTGTLKDSGFVDKALLQRWYGEKAGNLHHLYIGEVVGAWLRG